jgi:phytoene synthase
MRATAELSPVFLTSMERERLQREAAAATAKGSKSFSFATRFFPADLAEATRAIYWFCRTTDDLVDECAEPRAAAAQLDAWAEGLDRGYRGEDPGYPILRLFCETAFRYGIPPAYPRELIAGVRMDLTQTRYRDFAGLHLYCYRAASVVGLMMMQAIGYRGEPSQQAIDLGVAMQLTNILRDVGEDFRRGRIYLPQDEMQAFGCPEQDFAEGRRSENFRRLMQFQIQRARGYYAAAAPGIAALHERGRLAVQLAADIYGGILDEIEANRYDVFTRRAVTPRRRKCWIAARAMAWPALQRSARGLAIWKA